MQFFKKIFHKNIPIIDATADMAQIIKYLEKNYKSICNYPESLNIKEKERKAIFKKLWESWALHLDYEKFAAGYPQYNKDDLIFVANTEHARMTTLYHRNKYINSWEKGKKYIKELGFSPFVLFNKEDNLCLIYDMDKVFKCSWVERDGRRWIERPFFRLFNRRIKPSDLDKYSFWINGETRKLSPDEFLSWLKSYKIDYPLY